MDAQASTRRLDPDNGLYGAGEAAPPRVATDAVAPRTVQRAAAAPAWPIAESIARVHATFERIHPFLDGNGRAGRLLMNLVLVRLGYPPAIIYKREPARYLDALRKADQVDYGPLGELLARAVLDNLMRFILPAVAGPAKLVPLDALATKTLSVIALRNAAERGRLRARRTSAGTWQSSKQWVDAYKASRYKSLKQPRLPRRVVGAGARSTAAQRPPRGN